MKTHEIKSLKNKQGLRANGSILPLALRPGLGKVFGPNRTKGDWGRAIIFCSLFILLSVIGGLGVATPHSASAASITLSIPNALSLDISAASPSGTFAKSSKSTISTKTDSATGYTLSIKSKDQIDGGCLRNGDNKISSISSNMTEDEFRNSAPVNTWGYQPDTFNGVANLNFLPGPNDTESIIDKTKVANAVIGNNYSIVLAAKINSDLPAGTYRNTYTLSATANALTYSVHYNLNSGSGGPSPNPQTGQTDGDSFKLSDAIPAKDGYEFRGWCMTIPEADGSCKSGVFHPGDDFVIYCDENNIELYAIWEETGGSLIYATMQDFSCQSLLAEQTITLTDIRDMNNYTVAKLKDGQCWMTENLRIEEEYLHPKDSDVNKSFVLPASTDKPTAQQDTAEVQIDKKYGGYYSWFAATAGEGRRKFTAGNTQYSICPKGWKLPTKEEYDTLISNYNNNSDGQMLESPANFKLGGYGPAGSSMQETRGFYWTSTAEGASAEYYTWSVFLYAANVDTHENHKTYLYSVRCIARQ